MGKVVPKNEIARQHTTAVSQVPQMPDYLATVDQDLGDLGLQEMTKYIVPPRLKIVQKQSADDLISLYGIGATISVPSRQLIARADTAPDGSLTGESFFVVPVFFWPEWCLWNPYELKGQVPAIEGRSVDPASKYAIKARNRETWFEPTGRTTSDGKQLQRRYVEHLNFMVALVNREDEMNEQMVLMSFARAAHRDGSNLCNLIGLRRTKAPQCCVFEARVGRRKNEHGSWGVWEIANPDPQVASPWVMEVDRFEKYVAAYQELKAAYDEKRIRPDYDEDDVVTGNVAEPASQY